MPRTSIEFRTASKENYNLFKKEHPEVKINYTEWQNIIYSFNYNFRDYVLESGERAKMPHGFGEFMISKKRKKRYKTLPTGEERINLSIDWKRTKEEGKYIYHTNHHTEGFNFYWRWEPKTARFYQSCIWRFTASRVTSRLLKHYLFQPNYQHMYKEWG